MDEFFKLTYEMEEFIDESRKIDIGLEMYSEICNVIEQCGGVTPALEHMFGENFNPPASMETEATAEKDAWYKRLWQWIKDFFTKLWAWFKSWFQTRKGMIDKLQELKGKADKIKYPFKIPVPYKWVVEKIESIKVLNKILDDGASMQDIKDAAYERAKAKFAAFWKDISAEFDPDDDKRFTIKDSRELCDFINALISVFRFSEKISESYKLIETKFETMAKVAKASGFSTWVAKKSMVIASWNCNSKMFRAALRISNVLLARAKEA